MYDYVCMYVCMCVCVFVCMYVCLHACMHARMHIQYMYSKDILLPWINLHLAEIPQKQLIFRK